MEEFDPRRSTGGEPLFSRVVEGVQTYALYMLDPLGVVTTWNIGAERQKGYPASQIIGEYFGCFFLPEDVAAGLPDQELAIAAVEGRFDGEGWRVRQDGSRFWAGISLTAIYGPDSTLIGFAKVAQDLTAKKALENELRSCNASLSEERTRLQLILSSMEDGVISTDAEGHLVFMNPVAETMTGWTLKQASGLPIEDVFELVSAETRTPYNNLLQDCLQDGQVKHLKKDVYLRSHKGGNQQVQISAAPIRRQDGGVGGGILVFKDIGRISRIQSEMQFQASHDALTGLPNRGELEIRLQDVIHEATERDVEHTVCLLNVDRFKSIANTAGYVAGDMLLQVECPIFCAIG